MAAITKPVAREIVDDFAKEIQQRRTQTAKPAKAVINFRTDIKDGIERTIWRVPIGVNNGDRGQQRGQSTTGTSLIS